MKIIIEAEAKEIAALVLELQERQGAIAGELISDALGGKFFSGGGIKLCRENILKNE